jgi:hypothetical protein
MMHGALLQPGVLLLEDAIFKLCCDVQAVLDHIPAAAELEKNQSACV